MRLRTAILIFALSLLSSGSAAVALRAQSRITGRVINGTTHQPVANQLVQLLVPRGGMQQVATATTDAGGHFSLDPQGSLGAPITMVQAVYQDVNYRTRVTPGEPAEVSVYETTRTPPALHVTSARILAQAEGERVRVQELFTVENASQPPRTYMNPDGTFRFHLGEGAAEPQAAIIGEMNMPISQGILDGNSPGDFSINYSLHPGTTTILVSYEADYASGQFTLRDQVEYPIAEAELHVSPSGLAVDSPLFKFGGVDPTNDTRDLIAQNLAGGTMLEARLSGEATPSTAATSEPSEGDVQTTPNPLTRLGVPLGVCFLLVLLWALGVRFAKEWPRWKERRPASPAQKALEAKTETLLNSLADLEDLLVGGKITDETYWKEKLELRARLVAILKKSPPALLESYATRNLPR
ncbi:MAG: hypothetical protein LAN62_05510 [Acidobacteriia bacterium]|nr:hypothetical protein [Terriglobia bacterium]